MSIIKVENRLPVYYSRHSVSERPCCDSAWKGKLLRIRYISCYRSAIPFSLLDCTKSRFAQVHQRKQLIFHKLSKALRASAATQTLIIGIDGNMY